MSSCVRRHPNHDKCFVVKVLSPHLLVTGKKEEKNEKDNENEKEEERRREKEDRAIARTNQDCAAAETYKQRRYGPGMMPKAVDTQRRVETIALVFFALVYKRKPKYGFHVQESRVNGVADVPVKHKVDFPRSHLFSTRFQGFTTYERD